MKTKNFATAITCTCGDFMRIEKRSQKLAVCYCTRQTCENANVIYKAPSYDVELEKLEPAKGEDE